MRAAQRLGIRAIWRRSADVRPRDDSAAAVIDDMGRPDPGDCGAGPGRACGMNGRTRAQLLGLARRIYRVPQSPPITTPRSATCSVFGSALSAPAPPRRRPRAQRRRRWPPVPARHAGRLRARGHCEHWTSKRPSPACTCWPTRARLPFASNAFGGALSTAVLEHVRRPGAAMAEIARVCAPGGLVYIEVPFLQGFHASPNDYQRYTSSGVAELLRDFQDVEVGVCVGPSSALSWVLRGYLKGLLSGFSRHRVRETRGRVRGCLAHPRPSNTWTAWWPTARPPKTSPPASTPSPAPPATDPSS